MTSELRKKAAREGPKNIQTVVSDGCDVPLGDGSVDIVCNEHVPAPYRRARDRRQGNEQGYSGPVGRCSWQT